MKNSDKIPSAQFDYISDIIKEREQKSLSTFYTIYIEQYDKATPVAEKEEGHENFRQQILKFTSDYNLTSITVSLFSAKSRNAKPFQNFKVLLTKQTPTVVFSGMQQKESPGFEQMENSIPVNRYYDEKFEMQIRVMRTEMEKTNLLEKISQLNERFEEKLKDKELYHAEQLKNLQTLIENQKDEIRDFEYEIAKGEKDKHNSFGNIALGSISARAIENLAKSNIGMGVLKGLLGKDGYDTLQGHLAGIEQEQTEAAPQPTARIITEPVNSNDPKQIIISYIQKVYQSLSDKHLRMLYDIMEVSEKNNKDLELLWSVAMQVKKERSKPPVSGEPKQEGTGEEGVGETNDEDDTSQID